MSSVSQTGFLTFRECCVQ